MSEETSFFSPDKTEERQFWQERDVRQEKGKFMSRRELREQVFQILFRIEFHSEEEYKEQLALFFETEDDDADDKNREYVKNKVDEIISHLEEIDAAINEVAKGWKTTRMGKVDLTIIRLATYEIKFEEDVPTGVAINEAVELAKLYGTDESSSFVNGVLAKIA